MTTAFGGNGGPAWTPEEIGSLPPHELAYLNWQVRWNSLRRTAQIPPPGDWHVWNILAGRGFGKTRVGAETLSQWAISQPNTRWLVAGPTSGDVRGVCFEGESGLLNVIPPRLVANYNKSLLELTVHCVRGGTALIKGIPAEEPERFRGYQHHGGWFDELAAWKYLQAAWDMIMFGMRLGEHPRMILTTTPRPKPLISQLATNKIRGLSVITTRGSSRENFKNLAPTFKEQLLAYEGTQLGRQEIDGEILDAEESGIIKRSWFNLWPARLPLPAFDTIVMSLDTAFTEESRDKKSGDPDYSACLVFGVFHSNPIGHKGPPVPGVIVLDAWDERLSFPELLHRLGNDKDGELHARYGGTEQKPVFKPLSGPPNLDGAGRKIDTVVIENKGSGISLRQMMEREGVIAYSYNPGKADKLARLHAVSHIVNAGVVYLWESENRPGQPRDWNEKFLAQVCTFSGKGSTAHDDYVDCLSQGLRYLADQFRFVVQRKRTKEEIEGPEPEKPQGNPYAQ